jgi:lysophospholipase L1-like esterase
LHKFAERRPTGVALAHYGLVPDPMNTLVEAEEILRTWAEVAEAAYREGRDIAAALSDAFAAELEGVDPVHREKLETLNGIHSNAAGFRRWLETRNHGHSHDHPHPHSHPH